MTASRGRGGPRSVVEGETLPGTMDPGPAMAANCADQQLALRAVRATWMALAIVSASALGVLAAQPVLADDQEGDGHGHERGHRHERADEHHRYRMYAPPAVYYAREASPGITLFIPFEIR